MKVILRADVENLGSLGEIVEVRPGYGRNYLLPQGLAMTATASNMKVFEMERKKLQEKMDAVREAANTLAAKIGAADISIAVRVGENDKLYGSVTAANIAEALAAAGVEIDRRRILLDAPIRSLGEFDIRVRLHADVDAELSLKVVAEGRTEEEDAEEAAEPTVEEAAE
ncbi:50S ribosomal protein L9 [Oleidesulfovibrio sp.]|uniref:50S ribosomal protein L9 n=1 Tax=Oleidesulfovibrio sp. TaxID=2909707 RepID=UPI003A8C3784